MHEKTVDRVWQLAEPVIVDEGLEMVDVEFRREGRGMVLRLYLDRAGGVGGIGLDELSRISRQLGDLLDVHDAVPGSYLLEVSSPGINRRLRRPDHFQRYLGKKVCVKTHAPIDGRRNFVGTLAEVQAGGVVVDDAIGQPHTIPFVEIAQAHFESEE